MNAPPHGLAIARAAWAAVFLGLSPLLWVQGTWARRKTPVLPQPEGPRAGRVGSGPTLRLLIAGDSAAAGVGVDHPHEALAGQLQALLSPRFDLHWQVLAGTGTTTADLLERLQREPPRPFDAVVLSLGVNDVTGLVRLRRWLQQQRALLDVLRTRFEARRVILSAVPPMQAMRAMPQPLRWVMGRRAALLNAALAAQLHDCSFCELVHLRASSLSAALARDGFHPGALTYASWAAAVAARLQDLPHEGCGAPQRPAAIARQEVSARSARVRHGDDQAAD